MRGASPRGPRGFHKTINPPIKRGVRKKGGAAKAVGKMQTAKGAGTIGSGSGSAGSQNPMC